MLYRKAYEKLTAWKSTDNHKALCIVGARQIGKTTIIRNFAQNNYECFIEVNFVTDNDAIKIFDGSLSADSIITNLTAFTRSKMIPGKTLVFFDEVQECPQVRTAIKFLIEDGRFDYIESGSLLGVRYKDIKSYPVGFEEIYRMYPLDFEEFLLANSIQTSTIDYLRESFLNLTPVSASVHSTITKLFQAYTVVGGMPQVVQTYIDTHDIGQVIEIQKSILEQYRLDITKYAEGSNKIKITAILDSIPSQLNDTNRRFIVTNLSENARQLRYQNSFQWLNDAGVALPCYNVSIPQPPLVLNEKHSLFRLFMNDTGLLCAACMQNIQFDLLNGNLDINMGSILENVMAQQIKANGFNLNYYESKKNGEIDFVIQNGTNIELLEIKSGKDFRKHASLDKVRKLKDWKFNRSIVFCKENILQDDGVIYLPWYDVIFLKPDTIPLGTLFEVDISNL